MAATKNKPMKLRNGNNPSLTKEQRQAIFVGNLAEMTQRLSLARDSFMKNMLDRNKDIDKECGYPPTRISLQELKRMYDREGIATRVVNIYPSESWQVDPKISENQETTVTEFEQAWQDLDDKHNILSFMNRADEESGIGSFGILLLGFGDGKDLDQPVAGINERGEQEATTGTSLLYLRVFDETCVQVVELEQDLHNPRYGQPVMYRVLMSEPKAILFGNANKNVYMDVHWSRVLHLSNDGAGKVFSAPRMEICYNRLIDIRKILSSAGEGYWKGSFPGFSFEVSPEVAAVSELDTDSLRQEFAQYSAGLQRYLALVGVTAKSLAPQVASPVPHLDANLKAISISIQAPMRLFMGAEESRVSSNQDTMAWNTRIRRRQTKHINPWQLRPLITRFIYVGVLPQPKTLFLNWPDINIPTDKDKADVASLKTDAMVKYVSGGVVHLMPPLKYLTVIMGLSLDEAKEIMKISGLDEKGQALKDMHDSQSAPPGGNGNTQDPVAWRGIKSTTQTG